VELPRSPGPTDRPSDRLRGAPAVKLHLTLALGLVVCVGAFVIEMFRAVGGNELSWCYVFEWPIFAIFAVYMWWNLLHGRDSRPRAGGRTKPAAAGAKPAHAGDADPDLEAWNRYLRELDEAGSEGPAGGR
jgi:hypothetical protein